MVQKINKRKEIYNISNANADPNREQVRSSYSFVFLKIWIRLENCSSRRPWLLGSNTSSLTASQTSHSLASEVTLLKDPPCCPDLASCDFFFVLQTKFEGFKNCFFRSNSEDWSELTDECFKKQREFKNKMKFDSFVEALKIRL
jgi:hypothetical protein